MTNPAQGTIEPVDAAAKFTAIAKQLKEGHDPAAVTVRTFLSWFGAQRRGYWIVRQIRKSLKKQDLVTDPDFEGAFIDAEMTFHLALPKGPGKGAAPSNAAKDISPPTEPVQSASITSALAADDPTYRIGKLPAANRAPVSVKPDASVQEAISHMMMKDYSQLPVLQTDRNVKGVVSWQSIGRRLALGPNDGCVRDFMDPAAEINSDRSLFAAIPLIVDHQYVLVRGPDARITGIVTATDLSLQFQQLAEPFLLLGEIENHLRRLIEPAFTLAELQKARDPNDAQRAVEGVSHLTFGEYVYLLQEPNRWTKLGLKMDRNVFINQLQQVNEIRNDVMHFDPDPVGADELNLLRSSVAFFRGLRESKA